MASTQVKLPHNFDAIVKDADSEIDKSSDKLIDQLQAGIPLNQNKLKFWVDKISGANCFEFLPASLSFPKGEWLLNNGVAELLPSQEFKVKGSINPSWLSPTNFYPLMFGYRVSFVIKKTECAFGWEVPVSLELLIPGRPKQERQESLADLKPGTVKEILVGKVCGCDVFKDIEFSMRESSPHLMAGLVVLRAIVMPFFNVADKE